jgi:hypothetical protein
MTGHLILTENPTTYDKMVHANYAATMKFVMENSGKGGTTGTGGMSESSADLKYIKKAGDSMAGNGKDTGILYLVSDGDKSGDTYTDTNTNRAATRAYVDSVIESHRGSSIPTNTNTGNYIAYTTLPDGHMMIYGRQVGTMIGYGADSARCTVSFTTEISKKFANKNYVVTITEINPSHTSTGIDLQPDITYSSNYSSYYAGYPYFRIGMSGAIQIPLAVATPMSFSIYYQDVDKFSVYSYTNGIETGTYLPYYGFNFTAIGMMETNT